MIKKVIEIDVDELQAIGGLNNLNKAVQETDKQTASLKTQIKEATIELVKAQQEFGDYSEAALNAAKNVAILKDKVQEASETSKLFDPGAKFQAATGAIAAGANAVQGYQAALGLLGVEGEAAQETLLKVQSAMALSQSLSSIADSAKDFKRLAAVAQQYTIVQKAITAGQWLWNAAQAANPIGAIVAAVVALIAAGVALTKYFMDNAEAAKINAAAVEKNKVALESQTKTLERNSEQFEKKQKQELAMAKASGASAEAIRKLELKLIDEKIAYEKSQRAIAENTYQKNLNTLASLKAAGADEEVIKKQQETANESIKQYNKQNQDVRKALDEKKDIQERHLVEIKTAETSSAKETAQKRKEAQDKARQELKDQQEKAKEELKKQKDALKAIEENNIKEIADLKIKTESEKVALQKQRNLAELDAIKLSEEEKAKARLSIEEKYKILEAEAKIKDKETKDKEEEEYWNTEAEKAIERQNNLKEKADKEVEIEKAKEEQKAAILQQGLDTALQGVGLLKGLFEKNKGVQKAAIIAESAIGIGKMIIANNQANIGALATPQAIASSGASAAPVIAFNNISTGIGIAANLAATAKALSAVGGGGGASAPSGGGRAPSGGGGGAAAPSFNVVGNSGVNQIQQTLGMQQQQPIQAYVVANNVTTAQSLDRNIIRNASLG